MPIALPSLAAIDARQTQTRSDRLDRASRARRAHQGKRRRPGIGRHVVWSDEARRLDRRMAAGRAGRSYAWQVSGVGFDDAFRNALRGAAQVLSGDGQPDS